MQVDWQIKAEAAIRNKDFATAEEILVGIGEQPGFGYAAASAINTLAFSILIPQQRFEEARLWLQDAINLEIGYESWNARSNLGICEFYAGNIPAAKRYFEQMLAAESGPLEEAREFLARIKAKDIPTPPKSLRLQYSDEWQEVDVSGPADPKGSQRDWYLRLIKYMDVTEPEIDLNDFHQAPAACATGFANGAMEGKAGESGLSRDAAAKAYFDYVRFKFLGIDENYDPVEYGENLVEEDDAEGGLKHLRFAAGEGNSEAMLRVGQLLVEGGEDYAALPWLKLALSKGQKDAQDLIDGIYDDSEDYDDEDEEEED